MSRLKLRCHGEIKFENTTNRRQYNGQNKKDKRTNNDLQRRTEKIKI